MRGTVFWRDIYERAHRQLRSRLSVRGMILSINHCAAQACTWLLAFVEKLVVGAMARASFCCRQEGLSAG